MLQYWKEHKDERLDELRERGFRLQKDLKRWTTATTIEKYSVSVNGGYRIKLFKF
jgi:hypothetical protein